MILPLKLKRLLIKIRCRLLLPRINVSKNQLSQKLNSIFLNPIASAHNREEFEQAINAKAINQAHQFENKLISSSNAKSYLTDGFCIPCNKNSSFIIDMRSGGKYINEKWIPNWRERLECEQCHMNNRQRLIAALIKQELDLSEDKNIYLMEQVTPIYAWAMSTFQQHNITGSEYLGHEYEGGAEINGIRHEDVENLSFSDNSLDLIISNDVFEHIPNIETALAECSRVLKNDGMMLATIPFHSANEQSITRASIVNGELTHILPAMYHGNPVSSDGSLVFTDFGWDILNTVKLAGFSEVSMEIYTSIELCHLGGGQLVLRAKKTLGGHVKPKPNSNLSKMEENYSDNKRSTLTAIMGEVLWHSLTLDPTIESVSNEHFKQLKSIIKHHHKSPENKRDLRILEVAAYAHTTGYLLAKQFDAEVVLTDISVDTLALGDQIAKSNSPKNTRVKRVAADFHDFPFTDGQFDVVYIASALHHTLSWQTVLQEMIRVVAPGGLLFLDNEPCQREFSFYKFCTNRLEQFRPFEQKLYQTGILETIAEPFLGSRPESLFGMVENQNIPINEFFNILLEAGTIEHKSLTPIINKFEKQLIKMRSKGKEALNHYIANTLNTHVNEANSILSVNDKALGYELPNDSEILAIAAKASKMLIELDTDKSSDTYKMGLSKLFGASMSVLLRKNGSLPETLPSSKLKYDWGTRKDVIIAYPEAIQKILNRAEDIHPNIQTSPEEDLREIYSSEDWYLGFEENGIRSLTPIVNSSKITCKTSRDDCELQILIRIYAHYIDTPYRLKLIHNNLIIATFDIYQSDSFLFNSTIDTHSKDVQLTITATDVPTDVILTAPPTIKISAARICTI